MKRFVAKTGRTAPSGTPKKSNGFDVVSKSMIPKSSFKMVSSPTCSFHLKDKGMWQPDTRKFQGVKATQADIDEFIAKNGITQV